MTATASSQVDLIQQAHAKIMLPRPAATGWCLHTLDADIQLGVTISYSMHMQQRKPISGHGSPAGDSVRALPVQGWNFFSATLGADTSKVSEWSHGLK